MKSKFLFPSLFLIVILHSCGLRYTPSETPEAYQQRRRTAIQNYLKKNLGVDSSSYSSIAFGQTEIIKPPSFIKLDSLYEIKYRNDQNHRTDKELESQIKEQLEIAENDKDKIKYLEYHVFNFGPKDTIQIIETEILTDKQFAILDQSIISTLPLPKSYLETYKKYLFEESFIYPETSATTTEEIFYRLFKEKANELIDIKKHEFILHTLKIMDLAHRKKSLQTVELLTSLTKTNITSNHSDIIIDSVNEIYSENDYYWLTVDCSYLTGQKVKFYFQYSTYLELKKMELIN